MAQALARAGFYISACPIVRSEGKSGFHSSEGNVRYDGVLVCRKWEERAGEAWPRERAEGWALAEARHWIERTLASGMSLSNADVETILFSQGIMAYLYTLTRPEDMAREDTDRFLASLAERFAEQDPSQRLPKSARLRKSLRGGEGAAPFVQMRLALEEEGTR